MYIKWNEKKYKILDSIQINKSSREVVYTDLKIDFSHATIKDLPYPQQEIKIYDKYDKLKFNGFLESYVLPELKKIDTLQKELNISLYTPRQLATKRTVTISRTTSLEKAINQALAPLFQDGFVLKEVNVPKKTVTVNLISKTVEETMNYFSNKYSIYWNIDEFKNITVNSIEYQFNKPVRKQIDLKNYKKEIQGFLSLTPSVENSDYANIINVKNARIFYTSSITNNITLKNGDRLDFENPIDISLNTAKRIKGASYVNGVNSYVTNLLINCTNGTSASIISSLNGEKGDTVQMINVGTDDSSGKMFVLNMDSTFKNLTTGFTYKGAGSVTISYIQSDTMLRYSNMKLLNWQEIKNNAGKITLSGQIEKVLDVQNGWFTVDELVEYVRSLFVVNNQYTGKVNIVCDKNNNINIGDRILINLPEYFTKGNFIVTGISEYTQGNFPTQYNIELRNTNLTENYIDLFRASSDIKEQDSQIETEYIVEYIDGEGISEIHDYDFKEYNSMHTLDFKLNC